MHHDGVTDITLGASMYSVPLKDHTTGPIPGSVLSINSKWCGLHPQKQARTEDFEMHAGPQQASNAMAVVP